MKRGLIVTVSVVLVLAALTPSADAGVMFFAGNAGGTGDAYLPYKPTTGPIAAAKFATIDLTIDGDKLTARIEETLEGTYESPPNLLCAIPAPAGSKVTIDSFAPDHDIQGPVMGGVQLEPVAAGRLFSELAKATGQTAILALTGREVRVFNQFPANWVAKGKKVTVAYTITATLKDANGLFEAVCPMPTGLGGGSARVMISVTVRNKLPLRGLFSPTHELVVQRNTQHEAVAKATVKNWTGGDDFRVLFVADKDLLGLRVLAHKAAGDDDGYFLLFGNPTGSAADEKPIDKDFIFVLDTSGSMRGEKIEQARLAIDYCLGKLNHGDRFNIITFGTEVKPLAESPISASEVNLKSAREFLDNALAAGYTNIAGALAAGLAGRPEPGRPRIMLFLTDGTPTAGELAPDKILEAATAANTSGTQVFVMGLGHDVNAHLLDKLAAAHNGSSEYVRPSEEIDLKVATLFNRLANPVLTDVAVAFGDLRTNSVYPAKLTVLFQGSEIMIAGRYRDGGTHTFTISGTLGGKKKSYTCKAELPTGESPANEYVATLWAGRKIGFLLEEIRLHGPNRELIEEVVRLSKQFGIVTEYTSFIASARGGKMEAKEIVEEARRTIVVANSQAGGQWAVNQAMNDRGLQQRTAFNNDNNRFVDRQGRERTVSNVRQVGRRAFYLREGQWVDAEDAGQRKTRVVNLFSDEYFALLKAEPEFARAQAVGWNISMNVGDERIEVARDGSTRDPTATQPDEPDEQEQAPTSQMNQQIQQNLNQRQMQNLNLNLNQIQLPPNGQVPQIERQQIRQK